MEVLPIKLLRDEDIHLVGKDLCNLAKLYQAGLGTSDGVVIFPPIEKIKLLLHHLRADSKDFFENRIELLVNEFQKIEIPESLIKVLENKKINITLLWQNLLSIWLSEIKSKALREEAFRNLTHTLSAQPIFFTGKIKSSGEAFYDTSLRHANIRTHLGKLNPQTINDLEEIVIKAQKMLVLPFIFNWIYDGSIKITKITPFTQIPHDQIDEFSAQPLVEDLDISKKSTVKVFLNLNDSFRVIKNIDGIIVHGEEFDDHKFKIGKLAEVASEYAPLPVLYKLADLKLNTEENIRGTLRLIHQRSLLEKEVEAFLYARNKQKLLNTQLLIPYIRSNQELIQIKRELSGFGISRKASLKFWLELSVPENFLNLEEYLDTEFDGAVINLDEISSHLGGFKLQHRKEIFYTEHIKSLLGFLSDGIKLLHKVNLPVIFSGKLVFKSEILEYIFEKGVWGVSTDMEQVSNVSEQLAFYQKHHLHHKVLN